MKPFGIPQPCQENFSLMTPTERGAFCEKCATDTFNFIGKSPDEIRQVLRQHIGQEICGQITDDQIAALNADFEQWSFRSTRSFQSAFLLALITVFGLGLFSCQDQRHEQELRSFQETTKQIVATIETVKSEREILCNFNAPEVLEEKESLVQEKYTWINATDFAQQQFEWNGNPFLVESYTTGGVMYMSDPYVDYLYETIYLGDSTITLSTVEEPTAEFSGMAFPNPTDNSTTLEITAPESETFQIDLYDMNGKLQRAVYSGTIETGTFRQHIELTDLPTGMYLIAILSERYKETIKVSKL